MEAYSIEDIEEQYSNYGTVQCECSVCGSELTGEPDADTLYCEECDKVVSVHNPLM